MKRNEIGIEFAEQLLLNQLTKFKVLCRAVIQVMTERFKEKLAAKAVMPVMAHRT